MTQSKSVNIIDSLVSFITLGTFFLMPLFFSPITASVFDLAKQTLLVVVTLLLLVLWMVRNLITKSFRITITPFTGPMVFFALVILASSLTLNLARFLESFINAVSLIFFATLFFVTATTHKQTKDFGEKALYAILSSGAILSILTVMESIQFGPGKFLTSLTGTEYLPEFFISPAGSTLGLISLMLPVLIGCFVLAIAKKSITAKVSLFAAAGLMTAGLVVAIFMVMPGKPNTPVFLPLGTSWVIAAENIKSPKKLLLGSGADDYVTAFSQNRGADFNRYEFWNTRFGSAHNYPLTLFTTSGLIGLLSWFGLIIFIFRSAKRANNLTSIAKVYLIMFGITTVTIFFVPNTLILTIFSFMLLTAYAIELKQAKNHIISELLLRMFAAKLVDSTEYHQTSTAQQRTEMLPLIIGIPVILLALLGFYGTYRVYAADVYFQRSLVATANNDGGGAYDFQRMAINLNPVISSYHRAYSATNLALANSLGSQEDLTEVDRQTVSTLVRQAIREGQAAVQINPRNPANWENLAAIYRNLIGVAEGSDEWTVSSYAEAINLDPTNPRIWLDLGGVFFQTENFPQAIELFARAIQLKPDWANAHYNLANAFAGNQELERAINQYDVVLSMITQGSSDYNAVLEEQNELKKLAGQEATAPAPETTTSELTPPPSAPSPITNTPLTLEPEDAPPVTGGGGFSDLAPTATPEPEPESPAEGE